MKISQEVREYAAARAPNEIAADEAAVAGVGGAGPAGVGEAEAGMARISERFREGGGRFMCQTLGVTGEAGAV